MTTRRLVVRVKFPCQTVRPSGRTRRTTRTVTTIEASRVLEKTPLRKPALVRPFGTAPLKRLALLTLRTRQTKTSLVRLPVVEALLRPILLTTSWIRSWLRMMIARRLPRTRVLTLPSKVVPAVGTPFPTVPITVTLHTPRTRPIRDVGLPL